MVVLAPPHAVGHRAIFPKAGRWCHVENAPELLDQWISPGRYVSGQEIVEAGLAEMVKLTDAKRLFGGNGAPSKRERTATPG